MVEVARDLIGCTVEHAGTAGVIVETEAYHESEPACHAFVGLTPRTRTLFGPPGRAYVYRSYGIHALLNAVCEGEGVGAAVLIRALEPTAGLEAMRARRLAGSGRVPHVPHTLPATPRARAEAARGMRVRDGVRDGVRDEELCSGPGKLTQALGVSLEDNGSDLAWGAVRVLEASTREWADPPVVASTRIGITRAVDLPWRFSVAGNPHVSRPRPRG